MRQGVLFFTLLGVFAYSSAFAGSCTSSGWNLCGYDYGFAYKRVKQDFCGTSPSFSDLQSFSSLDTTSKASKIQSTLKDCLKTKYWRGRDGILWGLAHRKVVPMEILKSGQDSNNQNQFADYYDDYNLFVYHYIDGHDVRGVLTANYHVSRVDDPISYTKIDDVPLYPGTIGMMGFVGTFFNGIQQPVEQSKRAGMLSTAWNLNRRFLLASVPRAAAAHMMRSYLNLEMAKFQGIVPPNNDASFPLNDYDQKGVTQSSCIQCHIAIDTMAYPFTRYVGQNVSFPTGSMGTGTGTGTGTTTGTGTSTGTTDPIQQMTNLIPVIEAMPPAMRSQLVANEETMLPMSYKENRMELLQAQRLDTEPDIKDVPASGYFMGKPVTDLVSMAQVAASSNYFAQAVVQDFWKLLFGHLPTDAEMQDYNTVWQQLMTNDQYHIDAMLSRLVTLGVYGAP